MWILNLNLVCLDVIAFTAHMTNTCYIIISLPSSYCETPHLPDETVCPPSTATTFSDDFPGTNPASNWDTLTVQDFEASMFQTLMSYDDTTGDDSWDIRIGSGGNIYSHYVPQRFGERVAPQAYPEAPWIDEVSDVVHMICTHDMCT